MELQSSSRKHSLEISWNDDRGSILGISSSRWWLSRPFWKIHVLQIGANRPLVSWSSQANRIWKHADRVYHGLPNVIHACLTPRTSEMKRRSSSHDWPSHWFLPCLFSPHYLDDVSVGCFFTGALHRWKLPLCVSLGRKNTEFFPYVSTHLVRWLIITSSARYLGSITILRRWLDP